MWQAMYMVTTSVWQFSVFGTQNEQVTHIPTTDNSQKPKNWFWLIDGSQKPEDQFSNIEELVLTLNRWFSKIKEPVLTLQWWISKMKKPSSDPWLILLKNQRTSFDPWLVVLRNQRTNSDPWLVVLRNQRAGRVSPWLPISKKQFWPLTSPDLRK
jgi:hypothetical protein